MDELEYWNIRDDRAEEREKIELKTAKLKNDYWRIKIQQIKEGE